MQAETGERLGNLLVVLELITEDGLVELLALQVGVSVADLDSIDVPASILSLVPQGMARRYLAAPVVADSQNLSLAMADPTDVVAIDDIEFATGRRVQSLVAAERAIKESIGRLYGDQAEAKMRKMMTDLETEIRGPGDLEIVEDEEDFDLAKLAACGHDVVAYDNLSSGKAENIAAIQAHLAPGTGSIEFVEADILDATALTAAIEGSGAVFHQAALASVPRSFAEPALSLRANVEGTACVLESARAVGVNTVVMASSSSLYGDTPTLPKHEGMPLTPISPYALSKAVDEQLLEMWTNTYGMRTVGLRYFNIFGPRQDPNSEYAAVVPKFITRMLEGEAPTIFGDGMPSRDFTFIDNTVAANFLGAGLDPITGERFESDDAPRFVAANVGIGERCTLLDVVAALNEILGTAIEPSFEPPRIGDVRDSQAAIDVARDELGY
jgi:UDP-glucose 4-epimerase